MFKPVQVTARPHYRLHICYEDGTEGEVDLSRFVGKGVFAVWNDPSAFEKVSIGNSGEIRCNGNIDLCPDSLYMEITGESPEQVFPNLKAAADA